MRRVVFLNLMSLGLCCLATTRSAAQDSFRVGGVEIGAKGVKAVAVETSTDPAKTVRVLGTKTINPTVFRGDRLSLETIQETAEAVHALLKWLQEDMAVDAKRISVVASSSVATAVNRDELAQAVRQKSDVELKFLTRDEEVRLSILGLMLRGDRTVGMLIDIGSGNTKGGTLIGGKLTTFGVNFGTVTYTTLLREETPVPHDTLRAVELTAPLREQLRQHPELAKAGPRYLTGGIVWAVATMTHPESIHEGLVPLKAADFAAVRRQLEQQPLTFPSADFSRVTDPTIREAALDEFGRVRLVFTPENLVAGLQIIESLNETFDFDAQPLYFARNGLAAWLLGYVVEHEQWEQKQTPAASVVPTPHDSHRPVQPEVPPVIARRLMIGSFPLVNGHVAELIAVSDGSFSLEERCPHCGRAWTHVVERRSNAEAHWRVALSDVSTERASSRLLYDGCQYVLAP